MKERPHTPNTTIIGSPIGKIEIVEGRLSYVHSPRYFSTWIKDFGSEHVEDANIDHVQLGHVLWIIANDDGNFFLEKDAEKYLTGEELEEGRRHAMARVGWEKGVSEMPGDITTRLEHLHEIISTKSWMDEENRQTALQEYVGIKDYILNLPEAQAYIQTYKEHESQLRKNWNKFLEEEVLGNPMDT